MSDSPLVTIVTPSYNQAAYLEQTIRSVLTQDYPNLEYLIVDGGSKDGSLEIIRKYSDKLAWWVSEPDHGQAEGINKGLQRAKGEYVAWLNSDDYYLPGVIAQAVELLQLNPAAAFVFGDVLAVDENSQITNVMHYGNWDLSDLMMFNIIGQPGVLMRRSILEKAGYLDLSYHYLLDHQLWLRMGLLGKPVYARQTWAAARFHSEAKNVAHAAEFGAEAYRIVAWMEAEPKFQPHLSPIRLQVMAGAHRMNARYLLDGDQPWQALKAYWKGLTSYAPIVLPEWHRMVYALLSILGLKNLRRVYLKLRYRIQKPGVKN